MVQRIVETVILALAVCLLLVCYGVATRVEGDVYTLTTVVVDTDRANDIVTCRDSKNNLWEFYGVEDWAIGDCATLLMNDRGTQSVYDDVVTGARCKDTHRYSTARQETQYTRRER